MQWKAQKTREAAVVEARSRRASRDFSGRPEAATANAPISGHYLRGLRGLRVSAKPAPCEMVFVLGVRRQVA